MLHILDYASSRKHHFRPPKPGLSTGLVIAQPTSETKIANFQVAVLVHLAHNGPRKLLEATAETSRLSRASTQAVPGYLQASDRDAPRSHLRRVEENKDEDEGHGAG